MCGVPKTRARGQPVCKSYFVTLSVVKEQFQPVSLIRFKASCSHLTYRHYARAGWRPLRPRGATPLRMRNSRVSLRGRGAHAKFARNIRAAMPHAGKAPPATYETIHTFRYHTMEFASANHYLQLFLDYFVFHGDKTKKIGLQTTENKGYYRNNEHSLREATDCFSAHFEPFLPSSRSLFLPCWVY